MGSERDATRVRHTDGSTGTVLTFGHGMYQVRWDDGWLGWHPVCSLTVLEGE